MFSFDLLEVMRLVVSEKRSRENEIQVVDKQFKKDPKRL